MSDMSARLVAHIGQQVARAEAAEAEVEGLLKRAEQAEAAIARVRELHEFDGVHSCLGCSDNAPWPCDTIRALDGTG